MICFNKMPLRCGQIFLALCFSMPAMAAVQVDLAVNGSTLTVTGNNAQCSGGPIGCIDVQHGTNPHLFFNLNGACTHNGPDYKLTAFRIGLQSKVWPTPSTPLPAHIAQDFSANAQDGYVDLNNSDNSLSDGKIKLKDHNRTAYTVYYDVTASHCTDTGAQDIHLDPQIKNRGN